MNAQPLGIPPLAPGRKGDPGLFGPGSAVWRIAGERILLAGGPAALLLQLAHPLIAAGVAAHTDFRADPYRRLRRTLGATLTIAFGDRDQAETAARGVAEVHRAVRGRLSKAAGQHPAGAWYDATDPELALWVHATLVHTALGAADLLIGRVERAERERYYEEAKRFALLFGVTDALLPFDYADFEAYFDAMVHGPQLALTEEAAGLAAAVLEPPLPLPLRLAGPAMRLLTAGLLPPPIRERFGLRWGLARRSALMATTQSIRVAIRALPPHVRRWPHHRTANLRVSERDLCSDPSFG